MSKEEFLERIRNTNSQLDQKLIGRAFDFAQKIYNDQKRLSGQTLMDHCIEISLALSEINLGDYVVVAGLLHEALEKVALPKKELEKEFGEEIAFLVEGVTNVNRLEHRGTARTIENLRKLFLATAKDIRVVIIKLVNRIHGFKTIGVFDKEKQKRLAKETLEIYAPIAYRLGMRRICGELEDAAFPIVMPQEHGWLTNQIKDKYQEREKYLQKLKPQMKKELEKAGVSPIEIYSRAKRYYSLYKKLQRHDMDLNRIYDLVALRIIVKNIDDCYTALGAIHKSCKPLPGRIKDYIAIPKPNGYRSLHTTVFCPGGKISEIQIKTPEMHKEAEYGIAAHWYYSEQKGLVAYIKRFFTRPPEKDLKWVQQIQKWQEEFSPGSEEFINSLKIDFFKDRIFVFTPIGDVIDLPEGATPIDFAYQVHTSVGNRCLGAKVDNKMVSLDEPLKNGQVVEIITQKKEKPSQDWLRLVKTNLAKSRIKIWFKKNRAEQEKTETAENEQKPKPQQKKKTPFPLSTPPPGIEIIGDTKILTKIAKCCQPKPPEKIIGYITINQGVSIHRANCPSINKKNSQRLIPVSWKQ